MTINRLETTSAFSAGATSLVPNRPASVVEDSLMVAVLTKLNSNAVTATGWTALGSPTTDGTMTTYAFFKVASGSEAANYTFSWTGSVACDITITGYDGCEDTTPTISFESLGTSDTTIGCSTRIGLENKWIYFAAASAGGSVVNQTGHDLLGSMTPIELYDHSLAALSLASYDSNGPTAFDMDINPEVRRVGSTSFTDAVGLNILLTPNSIPLIDVVRNEDMDNPGFDIAIENLLGTDTLTLTRREQTSTYADQAVTGFENVDVTDLDTYAGSDFEAPLFFDFIYILTAQSASETGSYYAEVSITGYPSVLTVIKGGSAYLKSVGTPAISIPILVEEFDTTERKNRILSNSNVLGRSNPVVLTDVVSGRTGELKFVTLDNLTGPSSVSVSAVEQLLTEGGTLLLQTAYPFTGEKDIYLVPDTFSKKRINKILQGTGPLHQWSVSFIEVDRPTSSQPVASTTWQDLLDHNMSWNSVATDYTSWLEVLQNP